MGTIRYRDGFRGRLLYVKPGLLPDIPAEIRAYAVQNLSFPHEAIIDQWFSESQFESYRGLGACQVEPLVGSMWSNSLASLYWGVAHGRAGVTCDDDRDPFTSPTERSWSPGCTWKRMVLDTASSALETTVESQLSATVTEEDL